MMQILSYCSDTHKYIKNSHTTLPSFISTSYYKNKKHYVQLPTSAPLGMPFAIFSISFCT